jgi:putative transposase
VAFIDAHRDDVVEGARLGVEPICRVLELTRPPSARACRDAYVCFIVDAFSKMIVGWRVAPHMSCHSDAGSQFTSVRYGERLAELGAVPSIGSVGDSFDNALAETVNGYYQAELIRGPTRRQPWKTVEDVELATLGWVH